MVIRVNDPMAYKSDILLGRITKLNGYEGAVTVKLEKIFSENIPLMESVFLEIEGRPVPFLISDSEYSGADILKLKFTDYDSVEKVSEFTGCRVFLTTEVNAENDPDDIQSLTGYSVVLSDGIPLGKITEVISNPGQLLLNVLSTKNREILIPFHEHFIVSIDDKKRNIIMDIPEGLADLN
jgi:16S rRNA processing protein RimM